MLKKLFQNLYWLRWFIYIIASFISVIISRITLIALSNLQSTAVMQITKSIILLSPCNHKPLQSLCIIRLSDCELHNCLTRFVLF